MENTGKLRRAIGFRGIVALCLNAVVGSGVFLLPSQSYKLLGPFSLWAPLIFAVPVFILVLCFAEAGSHFSEPGGAYLYARTAFGDFVGFETGWMTWLSHVTSLASLSNGFVLALSRLFPAMGTGPARSALIVSTLGILALVHLLGVRYGTASIYVFTFGKILPLVGFTVLALAMWKHNPIPAALHVPGEGTDWGAAALFMLFAYSGFENVAVPAGEFKNPRRDLPLALLASIVAIALIYALSQLAAMSALHDLSKTSTPIADAAAALIGPLGAIVVTAGALISMAGTNSGSMLEGSRMLYALSFDRPRLRPVSYVHPRFGTPLIAIAIHLIVAIALALGGSFAVLAMLSAVARLAAYLFTCAAVPRLRKLNEGFVSPGGMTVPVLGTLISLTLFLTLNRFNFLAAAIALLVGAVIAWTTRRVRSGGEGNLLSIAGDLYHSRTSSARAVAARLTTSAGPRKE